MSPRKDLDIRSNNSSPVKQQVTPKQSQDLIKTHDTLAKFLF